MLHLSMRRVASKATQPAPALPEAGAGSQRGWLMTDVPGVTKIEGFVRGQRHAVTGAAKIVEPVGGKTPGVAGVELGRRSNVGRRGTVTRFAANAEFARQNGLISR